MTTHKARSAWFQAREAWPEREAPVELLLRARAEAVTPAPAGEQWAPVGPSNIGGRMTCVVCHPDDPDRLWAGAAGGGVWRSSDGGTSWEPRWHSEPSLNVGSLAVDPGNPDVLYCGTGEANLSADSHAGVGVLRSLDAGDTWELFAPADTTGLPRRIGALAVDPFDSAHLLAGGVSHVRGEASGLFVSTDGGRTWTRQPLVGPARYWCHAVRFHPRRPGWIFVTIAANGSPTGIWRSRDGGVTWEHLAGGLPDPDLIGRTSLALAPSDPDVVYALVESGGKVLDVYRSDDAGDGWKAIGGAHFADERQMSYGNTIVVHPENPGWVLCGGVDLHRTTDGGGHWEQVTHWDDDRGTSRYAHADHHALAMPAGRPGLVYDLNDGGMDVSTDGGTTWENRSNGLATNMFYDVEVAAETGAFIAGGAQDNGTLATLDGTAGSYFELSGGDGGWVVIDRADSDHLFTTAQHMLVFRHRSADGWKRVSPPEADAAKPWMVFVAMDPATATTLVTGSKRVWRTTDDGDTWQPVSAVLDGSDITTIDIARADSRRIYVGTENGGVFRSTDGGATWSGNLASTVLPGLTVTRVSSRADNAEVVYATVANFGNRHVFRSADGGVTWTDVDRGDLPDAPVLSMALPSAHPDRIYVCGDAGVFVSDDEGATWANLTGTLPNVTVVDLVYHETDRTLTAATYGRSIWRLVVD
ncbi:hypothetical protein [Amycolatopsis sp. NPDC021455]|uniref:WD40/YVTN/BNR-like repeat-containing protein n=1 Tax=Amycolatopsis sp. NPDC021455 TaxID=3154901 RepID=UPI0033C20553